MSFTFKGFIFTPNSNNSLVLVKDTNELPSIVEDLERAVRSIDSIKYVVACWIGEKETAKAMLSIQ